MAPPDQVSFTGTCPVRSWPAARETGEATWIPDGQLATSNADLYVQLMSSEPTGP